MTDIPPPDRTPAQPTPAPAGGPQPDAGPGPMRPASPVRRTAARAARAGVSVMSGPRRSEGKAGGDERRAPERDDQRDDDERHGEQGDESAEPVPPGVAAAAW